jgi:hypothetical protein
LLAADVVGPVAGAGVRAAGRVARRPVAGGAGREVGFAAGCGAGLLAVGPPGRFAANGLGALVGLLVGCGVPGGAACGTGGVACAQAGVDATNGQIEHTSNTNARLRIAASSGFGMVADGWPKTP